VGYDEGGQLTEAVRRRPYSVVLFDEVEKAHPDVFNVLLQLLDDGRLTDGQGRVVDFKNAIVIMTSNLGSDLILGADSLEKIKPVIEGLLKTSFKPEFLNRIDEIVTFNRLGEGEIATIVGLQLEALAKRMLDRKISLEVDAAARKFLASAGFDPAYGARPLKRAVQNFVQNPLAKYMLSGEVKDGDTVAVGAGKEGLAFKVRRPGKA
jgi:ATP-dependent Clp protease ATP-binding subunit ClpB